MTNTIDTDMQIMKRDREVSESKNERKEKQTKCIDRVGL
jgi:hypothetical protein